MSASDDAAGWTGPFRALTREIDDIRSPVRRFFSERFTSGLRDLQRRFRQAAPLLAVPRVPQAEANPGTLGGAADWLLRFLACPDPSVDLAVAGAAHISPQMMLGETEVARLTEAGIFAARYDYLTTWNLAGLLSELAGHPVSLPATRQQFRQLLLAHQD